MYHVAQITELLYLYTAEEEDGDEKHKYLSDPDRKET